MLLPNIFYRPRLGTRQKPLEVFYSCNLILDFIINQWTFHPSLWNIKLAWTEERGSARLRDLSIDIHQNIVSKQIREGDLHESCSVPDADCFLIPRAPGNCDREQRYRTITGGCNNLQHPQWGSSYQQLLRLLPSAYKVGRSHFWDCQMNVNHFL